MLILPNYSSHNSVKQYLTIFQVPRVGIEPTLSRELDFESSASTNSATEAKIFYKKSKIANYFFQGFNI